MTHMMGQMLDCIGILGVYPNLPSGRILCSDRKSGLYLFDFQPPPEVIQI